MTQEALKLALEALEANYLLVNGTETHGGLEQCLDGYYSSCFDTDPINKQTEEAITAIKEALAKTQEPEYAWPTVADYERDVGFQTNEAFRMAWGMARITNKMLGHPSPSQRTWVGLTDEERIEIDHLALSRVQAVQMTEAKLKELNT